MKLDGGRMAPAEANGNVNGIGAVAVTGTTAIRGVANSDQQNGISALADADCPWTGSLRC